MAPQKRLGVGVVWKGVKHIKAHPRGHRAEKKQTTKAAIREAYLNGPRREVQIIPATHELNLQTEKKKLRVCAHCRVSTVEDARAINDYSCSMIRN